MASAPAFDGHLEHAPTDATSIGTSGVERVSATSTAATDSLHSHVLQSETQGDAIGGRKWSRLQTLAFIVLASSALWVAIGFAIYRLFAR